MMLRRDAEPLISMLRALMPPLIDGERCRYVSSLFSLASYGPDSC